MLEESAALQSRPTTNAPTASVRVWLILKLTTRHGRDRQVGAASSSRKGVHLHSVVQTPEAGTSSGDLLERLIFRCLPPTPAKLETMGMGPGNLCFMELCRGRWRSGWCSLKFTALSQPLAPCLCGMLSEREKWTSPCVLTPGSPTWCHDRETYLHPWGHISIFVWSKKNFKNYKPNKIYKECLKQSTKQNESEQEALKVKIHPTPLQRGKEVRSAIWKSATLLEWNSRCLSVSVYSIFRRPSACYVFFQTHCQLCVSVIWFWKWGFSSFFLSISPFHCHINACYVGKFLW